MRLRRLDPTERLFRWSLHLTDCFRSSDPAKDFRNPLRRNGDAAALQEGPLQEEYAMVAHEKIELGQQKALTGDRQEDHNSHAREGSAAQAAGLVYMAMAEGSEASRGPNSPSHPESSKEPLQHVRVRERHDKLHTNVNTLVSVLGTSPGQGHNSPRSSLRSEYASDSGGSSGDLVHDPSLLPDIDSFCWPGKFRGEDVNVTTLMEAGTLVSTSILACVLICARVCSLPSSGLLSLNARIRITPTST
jgi:hypothetical protein